MSSSSIRRLCRGASAGPLLYAHMSFSASVYLDKIYVVGGIGPDDLHVDAVERFDPMP